jgi:putative sigma-54 modulation protein
MKEHIMQINFTGHGIDITPALKTFTEEKFKKLERHYDRILSIHVVFHVEKLNQIAEATVHVTKDEIHAHASAENMYTSIDDLVNKLDRQLIKHKEKLDNHRE